MDGNSSLNERRSSLHVENYVNNAGVGGSNVGTQIEHFAEEFKKTVTIIFWYKSNTEPLRIQQSVPSFPYFQLSRLSTLISDLRLDTNSYIDTYNPSSSQWEQHTTSTVRYVSTQQRLLYRMRKSLFEGLREEECLGLREEVQLQYTDPSPSTGQKRYATDGLESSHSPKVHITEDYYAQQSATQAPSGLPTPPTTTDPSSPDLDYMYRSSTSQQYYSTPSIPASAYTVSPSLDASTKEVIAPQIPIPYHPHPPLKRWPNDYTVYELTVGFSSMDQLIASSPAGANMTQKVAFERIFGSRYVKSTVCRHRAIWKKADSALRRQFEQMGADERAVWGEFVRRVEGRPSGRAALGKQAREDKQSSQGVIDYAQDGGSSSTPNSGSVEDDGVGGSVLQGSLVNQQTIQHGMNGVSGVHSQSHGGHGSHATLSPTMNVNLSPQLHSHGHNSSHAQSHSQSHPQSHSQAHSQHGQGHSQHTNSHPGALSQHQSHSSHPSLNHGHGELNHSVVYDTSMAHVNGQHLQGASSRS